MGVGALRGGDSLRHASILLLGVPPSHAETRSEGGDPVFASPTHNKTQLL